MLLNRRISTWAVALAFGLAGAAMLATAGRHLSHSLDISKHYARTTGTVVAIYAYPVPGHRLFMTGYYPRVSFEANGKTYFFETKMGKSSYQWHERLPVWYDTANPSHAEIGSFFNVWENPLIFFLFGAVFLSAGLWCGFFMRP